MLPFNPLFFGEVDFIPDKINDNEDHATHKVSRGKEPDGASNVESPEQEYVGESASIFSPFDLRPPPGLPGPSTSGRDCGKAAVVTSSPYQRRLRESPDKFKKENDQSSAKKCNRFLKTR
jgi:hypothetical protein